MEAVIVIGCALFLVWHGIKDQYEDDGSNGTYQENEEKHNNNDSFWP